MSDNKKNVLELEPLSDEWWERFPEALTFLPEEQRAVIFNICIMMANAL